MEKKWRRSWELPIMIKRINEIAEKSGLSPEYIQENAELSPKKGLFAYAFSGRDITGKSVEDMVYEAQRNIILELAEKEPCVIIGRNADYILKDRDDVLNVFIHGDMPEKIQRITGLYNVEEKEAVKMMADTDKRRRTNYNFYTDQKWGKASNYTLCLNSSQLGYDRCEMIIMECVENKNRLLFLFKLTEWKYSLFLCSVSSKIKEAVNQLVSFR